MPHPHEYTMRDKKDAARETAYVQLFHLIQADGVIERWHGRKKRYLYPGDGYKYWAMTTNEPQSRVLNRMRVEDDIERLRQEGQIPDGFSHHERIFAPNDLALRLFRLGAGRVRSCSGSHQAGRNWWAETPGQRLRADLPARPG